MHSKAVFKSIIHIGKPKHKLDTIQQETNGRNPCFSRKGTAMIGQTQNGLLIRRLRQEDIPVIVEGERAQGWHPTEEKYLTRLRDMAAGRCVSLAAVLDGRAVGYLSVYQTDNGPELIDFGVLECCRGRGIGTKLMDTAEELAFAQSDIVRLSVGLHSGYGSTQRMYIKRGYLPDGCGAYYDATVCTSYESYPLDDSLLLRFSKRRPAVGSFLCRLATDEEFELLWQQNIEAHPDDPRWRAWREEYAASRPAGYSETFAVLSDGKPVGEGTLLYSPACGAIHGRTVLANGGSTANVNALRIQKAYEGRGGISALVRTMEAHARKRGISLLTIGVEAANARNLAIYLHWGYRTLVHTETEEGSLVLYYAKELGIGNTDPTHTRETKAVCVCDKA